MPMKQTTAERVMNGAIAGVAGALAVGIVGAFLQSMTILLPAAALAVASLATLLTARHLRNTAAVRTAAPATTSVAHA